MEEFLCILVVAVLLIFILMYLMLMYMHLPKKKLPSEMIEKIKKYGLMHFTLSENVESILVNGLQPGRKKPMNFLERNMVWMYIADPMLYEDKIKEIHSKGVRKKYDSVIYIYNISDEQLNKIKYRRKPEAIVFLGTLKTNDMVAKKIEEITLNN